MEVVVNIAHQSEKTECLFKLIALEPETLENLTRATGWRHKETQDILLRLIADSRITCRNTNGGRFYTVKQRSPLTSSNRMQGAESVLATPAKCANAQEYRVPRS